MNLSFNIGFFILTGLIGLSLHAVKNQDLTEFSWPQKVFNGKFSIRLRLEHGFGIEYTYLQ